MSLYNDKTKARSAEFLLGRLFEKYREMRYYAYSDSAEHLLTKTIAEYILMEVGHLMEDLGYYIDGIGSSLYVGWIDNFERKPNGHEKEIFFCEKCDKRIDSKYSVHCDAPLLTMREVKK